MYLHFKVHVIEMSYSAINFTATITELESKYHASIHAKARKYSILSSTLDDHMQGKHVQVGKGGPTVVRNLH